MASPILERVRLPGGLSADLQRALGSLQNNVEASLRRLLTSIPLLAGNLVEGRKLLAGTNLVPHGLGRAARGYLVISQDAGGSVFLSSAANARPESYIALETSTPQITVSLWVF